MEGAEKRALLLEDRYVHTKDILTYDALQSLHREISLMRVETTKKQLLAQSQRIFEERSSQSHIAHIKDARGELCSDPIGINDQFAKYYKHLYTSNVTSGPRWPTSRVL